MKDGQIFGIGGDDLLWYKQEAAVNWKYYGGDRKMAAVSMRKDGLTLLGAGLDRYVYTLAKGSKTWALAPGGACCVFSVAEADDGSFFGVGTGDNWLWRWPYFGAPGWWEVWDKSVLLSTLTITPEGQVLGVDTKGGLHVRGQGKSETWTYLYPANVTTLAPRYTVSWLAPTDLA